MAGSTDRPPGRFAGRAVVVLGGAGVLGAAAARAFAREGAKVAIGLPFVGRPGRRAGR